MRTWVVPEEPLNTRIFPSPLVDSVGTARLERVWPAQKATTLVPSGKALPG
jgi:hypothetical protein